MSKAPARRTEPCTLDSVVSEPGSLFRRVWRPEDFFPKPSKPKYDVRLDSSC